MANKDDIRQHMLGMEAFQNWVSANKGSASTDDREGVTQAIFDEMVKVNEFANHGDLREDIEDIMTEFVADESAKGRSDMAKAYAANENATDKPERKYSNMPTKMPGNQPAQPAQPAEPAQPAQQPNQQPDQLPGQGRRDGQDDGQSGDQSGQQRGQAQRQQGQDRARQERERAEQERQRKEQERMEKERMDQEGGAPTTDPAVTTPDSGTGSDPGTGSAV